MSDDANTPRFRAVRPQDAGEVQPKLSVTAELILHMEELIADSSDIVDAGLNHFLSREGTLSRHAADAIVIKFHDLADRMPPAVQDRHPEVPWADLRGMRNRLGHNYRQTDYRIVWVALTRDLPEITARLHGES